MTRPLLVCSLTLGLLLSATAPAQDISIWGGRTLPTEALKVEVSAPRGTVFTLERVLDPAGLFAASKDPHSPVLPAGAKTQRVTSVKWRGGDTLNFGRVPSGVYLVRSGAVSRVVIVTSLGLVVKRDQSSTLVYTADRQTGAVRPARVWALGQASATADAQGLVHWRSAFKENQVFLARYGNDWAISDSGWNSYAAPRVRGYVYTDRPVYRPGHHVDFKGVLRQAGSLKPLSGTALSVKVLSGDDEEVYRGKLTTDAYGSFQAGFDLSAGAKLGGYRFELSGAAYDADELQVGGSFEVEAYQKPEYEVTVQPDRTRAVQGEKVSVRLSAKYLFGGSLGGAKVNYNVTRARYYAPWFDADDLPPDEGQDYGSDLVIQEEARLNASGELVLTLPLARDEDGQPLSYRIEAEVEDESRRTVSSQARVIAFPAALTVDAGTDSYVYKAGEPIRVTLDTRDLKDVGRAAPVTLELVRQEWTLDRRTNRWVNKEERLTKTQVSTGAGGQGSATLSAPRGGGYLLRSTVRDAQGRVSTSENWLWVIKPGETWGWNYRELSLTLDKKTYQPGDTATLLIGNPTPGAPVLLTLEGEKLRSWTVLRGQGATLTYQFKVTADMTPNISVAAASLGGGNFASAEKTLRVPRLGAALSVSVKSDKARYAPGEEGKLSVQVRDASGQGVGADVALGVVDQAIYLVRRDDSPAMMKVFDAPRLNVVGTQSSLDFYFQQTGPQASRPRAPMDEAAFAQSKEADKADASQPVEPRQDFKDTILWVPNLLTDAQGRATVTVKYPDNLTTWVATARAQTKDPRFGQATHNTLVTKDVIARLSLPTFLVRGDQVTVSGIVNNTLGQALSGQASLALGGLAPVSGAALGAQGTAFSVSAGGRTRLDSVVRASGIGSASLTFTARTPGGSDALKLPLPVKARGYEETRSATGGASAPATLTIPRDATLDTLKVQVTLTPSLLSAVTPALDYLVGYPYGCTEQTMSRFLPALLARQTLGAGALPGGGKDLKAITEAGLARLETFQHEDGGWNFWENDDSTLEMTAYVTGGLLRAKSVGAPVSNAMLDRGLVYLAKHAGSGKERQSERATAYRVLAEAGRVNVADLSAFVRRAELNPYSLAQLSLALGKAGQRQAALDTLARLKAKRLESAKGGTVYWENPRQQDDWYWYWDDNKVQVTAAALEALAKLEPQSPLLPGVSQWLLQNRQGPRWVSTQDTTSVIIAALALPKSGPQGTTQSTTQPTTQSTTQTALVLDGKTIDTVPVGQQSVTVDIPAPLLSAGQHTLSVKGAPASLTFAAQLSYAREPAALSAVTGKGITLNRKYERLTPVWNEKDKRYTYSRAPLLRGGQLQPVTVGDLILVTLSVKPDQDARYLMVSDPIPAGMKALDERSLSIAGLRESDEYNWYDWNYWYSGRDLLDDRVDLYAYWARGQQTMTYLLRAQTPGTFTALPSHAFLMYDADVEGYGPAATFTVRDR